MLSIIIFTILGFVFGQIMGRFFLRKEKNLTQKERWIASSIDGAMLASMFLLFELMKELVTFHNIFIEGIVRFIIVFVPILIFRTISANYLKKVRSN